MRPAMMLLLRALVILGAVLAVLSCAAPTSLYASQAVPAAGGTSSNSGSGNCL